MEVKFVKRKLKEEWNKKSLLKVLELIGKAHDEIMEAQDELSSIKYEYEDNDAVEVDLLDSLEYILDDLESVLSEHDYMGSDDPIETFIENN